MKKNKRSIQFTVLTLFPDLIQNYLADALLSKAILQKRIQVKVVSLRQFAQGRYKSIDDVPYGGGDGMVFKASVLESAMDSLQKNSHIKKKVIYLSPQGKTWNHELAKKMAVEWSEQVADEDLEIHLDQEVILICGRYAGIDQRFIQKCVDEEISIGDYVLSGGELAALVMIESISRYVPGVLGDENSAHLDSFEDGHSLEAPQFTKPQVWSGKNVPEVLASGNHAKIAEWKKNVAALVTFKKRPDLFAAGFKKEKLQSLISFYEGLSESDKEVLQLNELHLKRNNQ